MKSYESWSSLQCSLPDALSKTSHQRADGAWASHGLLQAKEEMGPGFFPLQPFLVQCVEQVPTILGGERAVFQLVFKMVFPAGLISAARRGEREAYFLIREIKPLTFATRKCYLMKLKREKPTPATYQHLRHPSESQVTHQARQGPVSSWAVSSLTTRFCSHW